MDNAAYLLDAIRGFRNYKALGDGAMAQVPSDADFDRMLDPDSNSIAMIVQHIAGNFRSAKQAVLALIDGAVFADAVDIRGIVIIPAGGEFF